MAEEEIIEVEDLSSRKFKSIEEKPKEVATSSIFKKPPATKVGSTSKSSLANLVKRKVPASATETKNTSTTVTQSTSSASNSNQLTAVSQPTSSALSLLSGYDDSDESD